MGRSSTDWRDDYLRRSACTALSIGGAGARHERAIKTNADFAKPRRALAGAADHDRRRRKVWIGTQEIICKRRWRLLDRSCGTGEVLRNCNARIGAAHQRKKLGRAQAAASAVRRPFVVNETSRRHQVRNALHHVVGHRAVYIAMLRPTPFILRP